MDWLLASIDPARNHDVGAALAWHGRLMVLGWAVICPAAILAARYFKIMPGQDWPRVLDNPTWWHVHRIGQSAVCLISIPALVLILWGGGDRPEVLPHRVMGYLVLCLAALQVLGALKRGSKGGPTDPNGPAGDHFDMTPRRIAFETVHRVCGYAALALLVPTVLSGLWFANAPRWMWLAIGLYWLALAACAIRLQRAGRAYDTYQAIWGPDPDLPGNRRAQQGWATVRPAEHRAE